MKPVSSIVSVTIWRTRMAKAIFGEYAAFDTPGGVRFMHNKKMASEKALPPEVVAFLKSKLAEAPAEPKPAPKFPRPSEEELKRMREESLRVPPELQISPEEEAQRALTGVPDNEAPLQPDDFEAPVEPAVPNQPDVVPSETLEPGVDPSFLESVSIHTAPIEAIAQALYDRFGIYTVYLRKLPVPDEVNPLTAEPFTKYHQGIAYQAAIAAQNKGVLDQDLSYHKQIIDQDRNAHQNFREPFVQPPQTMSEAREQNSYAFRTSARNQQTIQTEIVHEKDPLTGQMRAVQREIPVEEQQRVTHSRYDQDEETQVVEPPIFGTKPIVKPNW